MASQEGVQETIKSNPHACGLAIIVSNDYRTSNNTTLSGTEVDAKVMKEAFETLKFATHVRPNLKANEIEALAKEATKCSYPDNYKCIAFVFSGHGCDKDRIIGKDDMPVRLSNIVEPFYPENAQMIGAIPKLFFIDACRGGENMTEVIVPRDIDLKELKVPAKGNVLVAHSTWLECFAYESQSHGGLWMSILAETITQSNEDIGAILTEVNEKLTAQTAIQQPEHTSSLNVRVYLRKLASGGIGGSDMPDTVVQPGTSGDNGGDAAAIERQLQPHTVSQPAGKVSHDTVVVEKQSQSHANGVTTSSSGTSASNTSVSADTPLKMKNRPKIMKYLRRIGNPQTLLELGESLGLDGTVLRTKTTTDTFLYDLVGDWLNRVNTVDEEGTPTWRKLAEALEDVQQNGIAIDIKKDMGF